MIDFPQPLVAVYISIPKFSDDTPAWEVALYGLGCIVTLFLMYALIKQTRREKGRRKHSEGS